MGESMSHFIEKCSCGKVISQCRCWSKDKEVTVITNGCGRCKETPCPGPDLSVDELRILLDGGFGAKATIESQREHIDNLVEEVDKRQKFIEKITPYLVVRGAFIGELNEFFPDDEQIDESISDR
jgi:hypothetical protein